MQQQQFSVLFGKGAHGRTLSWRIWVQDNAIHILHGELNGKQTEHVKVVANTKSTRTPFEQAVFEAERKWKDQREKKNYVEHVVELERNRALDFSQIRPMLATNYARTNTIAYPVLVQRKYDGVRCLAFKSQSQSQSMLLYSRRGKPFHNLEHIRGALRHIPLNIILDGELYKDSGDFQSIAGTARKKTKDEDEENMYYVIYDGLFVEQPTMTFEQRYAELSKFIPLLSSHIRLAPNHEAISQTDIQALHDTFVADGFEGAIIRNPTGIYETDKRSKHLLKMKEFDEEEFPIVGFSESSGNDAGTVIWTVQTQQNPPIFTKVKHTGSLEMRQQLFEHGEAYIGQLLTVKFFGKTNDGNLRFPVGKSVRNYE